MKTLELGSEYTIEELINKFKAESAIKDLPFERMEEIVKNMTNTEMSDLYDEQYLPEEKIGGSLRKIFNYEDKELCFKALFVGLLNIGIKHNKLMWMLDQAGCIESAVYAFK